MNTSLPTTRIGGMTLAQYQTTITTIVGRVSVVNVSLGQAKSFMRPTIYSLFVSSPTLKTIATVSTYGTSGELWAISFDDGASWLNVDSFGECVNLLTKHFSSWQD